MINFLQNSFKLIGYEIKMIGRSPVWLIGLTTALYIAYEQTGVAWDTLPFINASLYGFHESFRMILLFTAFLLAANSIHRDLKDSRKDILFTKPIQIHFLVFSKLTASLLVSIGMTCFLLGLIILRPFLAGYTYIYDLEPFLYVCMILILPSLFYIHTLAILLAVLFRRMVILVPCFFIYMFYTLYYAGHHREAVIYQDFTMRLEPIRVHLSLHPSLRSPGDFSFAHYFHPLHPDLFPKSIVYVAASFILFIIAIIVMHKKRG